MAKIMRSKNNDKYFQVIPGPKIEISRNEVALEKSQALAKLVHERLKVLDESREIRQKLYNLSQDIHSLEKDLADLFMEELK